MPKLKYSDLPPFRWYPVEEVEFMEGESVLTCCSDDGYFPGMANYETVGWTHPVFVSDCEIYEVEFVMRLLTPKEQMHADFDNLMLSAPSGEMTEEQSDLFWGLTSEQSQ